LERAREFRNTLNGYRDQLEIASRDLLDSFGIDRGSNQGLAYSFTLQIIDDDILAILHSLDDYEIQTPTYIIGTEIEGHTCGLGEGSMNEIELRVRDVVGASDELTVADVFRGTTCSFEGVVVDDGLIPIVTIFNQAGCPLDGSPAPARQRSQISRNVRDLIRSSRDNRDLVIIGGEVRVSPTELVSGVRFDEDRNVFGLGWIRRNIRDEIVAIDNTCTLIRENDFIQSELGVGEVVGFTCVSTSGCLQNQRVDTRSIRRQLASGRLNVELIETSAKHFFRPSDVIWIPRPSTSVPPRREVDVREIPCTVNSRCKEGQGTCYRDVECESGLMCHPGTTRHPDYIYENPALSFCVPFERIRARDRNVCSPDALCDDGEGSCQSHADCQGSLQCRDARNNAAYDLGNNILQKICVRPQTPFDPENCECCGANSGCDHLKLQVGDGHCMNHDHCAEGLTCVPKSCGLFRAFSKRTEFLKMDSCCMDLRRLDNIQSSSVEGIPICGEEPVDYFGNDLYNIGSESAANCQEACANDGNCRYWTYAPSDSRCYLKSTDAGRKSRDGHISGPAVCPSLTDQSGFEGIRNFPISESDFNTRASLCGGECAKEPRCHFWTAATDSNHCWLWSNPENIFARASNLVAANRVSYPNFAHGETPYGCPKGFVRTLGDDFEFSLYYDQLRCKKKPADKVCGHGMRYERTALQGEFDTSSVERDISVCRKRCAGCGAFRYNTDTSECAIFHRLDITLSDHDAEMDEIVCVYDSEQSGERRVSKNICLGPRSLRTSFSTAISGRILSASLTHRSGEVKCLERRVEECPSGRASFTGVLGRPDYCDCCLHGSSCNRCPDGFHSSGFGQSCSGRGEFRCNSRGEVHAERSSTWACDATQRAQIVLETDTHTIHFDDFKTQASSKVLISGAQDHGFVSQTINVRYTDPTDGKFVFAEGEVCFDVQLVIDDSQVAETPEVTCYCDTPGSGIKDGFNSITCTNGETHYCDLGEECFTTAGFPFSARHQGCRKPRVERSVIQFHSTECNVHGGLNTLSNHNVVCPDGFALSAWKVNTCTSGLGVKEIDDNVRCRQHIWLNQYPISAQQCADIVRRDPRCQGTNLMQWAERTDRNCGCFARQDMGFTRHCQFGSGRVEDDPSNVYELFGVQIDYECVPIREIAREERHSTCESTIGESLAFLDRHRFQCDGNQALKEFRLTFDGCGNGFMRYNYVCSTTSENQEQYSVDTAPCIPTGFTWTDKLSESSARCGTGDLMLGWSFPRCDGASHRLVAQCARRPEGYEPVQGNDVVCSWEGTTNGIASSANGNAVNCGRICDSRADCNSFTICGDTCHLTGDAYTNDQGVWPVCRNDSPTEQCRSYTNTKFVL